MYPLLLKDRARVADARVLHPQCHPIPGFIRRMILRSSILADHTGLSTIGIFLGPGLVLNVAPWPPRPSSSYAPTPGQMRPLEVHNCTFYRRQCVCHRKCTAMSCNLVPAAVFCPSPRPCGFRERLTGHDPSAFSYLHGRRAFPGSGRPLTNHVRILSYKLGYCDS
jgi:hypothetical protein